MSDRIKGHKTLFRLEEATIADLHEAIRAGKITLVEVVQRYLDRARAYNGVACLLLTEDGANVPEAKGAARALAPLQFPTETVKASTILPDLDKYKGPPLEFGRMEPTASDPDVYQQYGMIVGMPNAGQVNAIGTLTSAASVQSLARESTIFIPRRDLCRRVLHRSANSSDSNRTRWSGPPSSMRSTDVILILRRCQCTALSFRLRIYSIRPICGQPVEAMRPTISTFPRGIMCLSGN